MLTSSTCPAVHIQPTAQLIDLGQHRLSDVDRQTGDVDREALLVFGRTHDQHDVTAVSVGHEQGTE
jgi:hypothetical protein